MGRELRFLYNDSYAEILGAKHPNALGSRFDDIWSEIWPDISPLVDAAMSGQAIYREDLPLVMNRKGYDEQTWFTFSYSPVRDENGEVGGMFCAVHETTRPVLAERALRDLNETLERRVNDAITQRKVLADIVEGTNAFVQVADLDYRWLAVNKAAADEFERIFGKRPQVGASMLELLADQPEHQAAVKAVWSRALAGEEFVADRGVRRPVAGPALLRDALQRASRRRGPRRSAPTSSSTTSPSACATRSGCAIRSRPCARRNASSRSASSPAASRTISTTCSRCSRAACRSSSAIRRAQQREIILGAMRRAVTRGTGLTRHLLAFSRRHPVNPESIDLAAHLETMRQMLESSLREATSRSR